MKEVKNKAVRQTIIVLVVLLVVILDLVYYKSKDPKTVASDTVDLIMIAKEELESVVVTDYSDKNVIQYTTFNAKEDGIAIETTELKVKEDAENKDINLKGFKAKHPDENVIKLFEFTITNLQALKTIQENATDIEQFGLDKPLCEVDMKLKNGEEKGFIVGNNTPTSQAAYYLKMKDSNAVYTLSRWDVQNILLTDDSIIDYT